MATTGSDLQSEIKTWLEVILENKKVTELSVEIVGTEKGDGDMGEIIFVGVTGLVNGEEKKFDLALKCSTRNEAIRKAQPVRDAFLNEIAMYEKILPYYEKYQEEKAIETPFKAPPVYFGSYVTDNMEVIALQNMNVYGYKRWPKKQPLTKRYVEAVLIKYAKFHGTSFALQRQDEVTFQPFLDSLKDTMDWFTENSDLQKLYGDPMDEAYELLKGEVDDAILQKWKGLKDEIDFVVREMHKDVTGMKVILHGDCWRHNYMFLPQERKPIKTALLDFQRSRYSSPMFDLSHFVFSTIGSEALEDLDNLLFTYYVAFLSQMLGLGVEKPGRIWLLDDFFADWKRYSKYGLIMACRSMKILADEPDEVLDLTFKPGTVKGIGHPSWQQTNDKDNFKKRIRPIIEFAVEKELI